MRSGILWVILIFQCFVNQASGQTSAEVKGIILDSKSGMPMPFAQIALQHSTLGTVSNDEGCFRIRIPALKPGDSLVLYYLGYETMKVPATTMAGKEVVLKLKPRPVELSEMEVIGLTPEEVIRRAVIAIPENYGADSLLLTAFVRSQKFFGNRLAEYAEAIVENLKTGYFLYPVRDTDRKMSRSNVPLLLKGRVISDTSLVNGMGDVGKRAGCLGCNFINDLVEFYHGTVLDPDMIKYHTLKMDELADPEGGKIYRIRFDQSVPDKKLFKGEILINGSCYAVMKISVKPSFAAFDQYEKTRLQNQYKILDTPGWIAEMPLIDRTVTYTRQGRHWSLRSIRETQWVTFTQTYTGKKLRMGYKNDVVITDVCRDSDRIRNFRGDKSSGSVQRWDQLVGETDENFWKEYNYLPIEETLKKEIEEVNK